MKRMCLNNYTIQCTDEKTGQTGCFFFDQKKWVETGKFFAVSKVYKDLVDFYKHTKPEQRQGIYLEREFLCTL